MGRRRRKPLPIFEDIEILDAGAEGKAVTRVDDIVLFITGGVPGDVVDVQVTRKKKSFMEGKVINIKKYSEKREKAFCSHFGLCGGCKWQELPYSEQLHYKQKQVKDNFDRLGKLEYDEFIDILGSKETQYYRNKLEFTFTHQRWLTKEEIDSDLKETRGLGFHIPGRFDKIVDVNHCYLQGNLSNEIRNSVRTFALENDLSFFDLRVQKGLLRNLIIRTASTGDLMVIVAFFENDKNSIDLVLNHLKSSFPQITSLMYVVNEKKNDSIGDQDIQCFEGNDFILEEMEGIQFKVGPKSFYQTNSEQAYELYKITRDFAGLTGEELVYDLYTGTGTIANFVAKSAKKVIGVEYVPEAIEDAKVNSEHNKIDNTLFFAGDMKDVLTNDFIAEHGRPDVIITDPPRAGMHENVVNVILNAAPQRVVYVSCNPATQARDLALMKDAYKVLKVQPVDMFPHTHHVENVVLLERI